MLEKPTLKFLFVLAILLLFAYLVYPTYRFNTLSEEKKQRMKVENPDAYEDLLEKSIKLGLDLQGGMNLVMEVDVQSLLDKLAKNKDERFQNALQAAAERAENEDVNVIDAFEEEIRQRGADIALYYGTRERRSRQEIINYLHEQEEESIDRTLEILRNRVDQFGVSEPNIQKQGNKRIIIELAGITDRQRALELVGKTAKLEFRLLEEQEVTQRVASRINEYLTGGLEEEEDTVETEEAPQDTTEAPQDTAVATPEELFGEGEEFDTTEFDTTGLAEGEAEAEQGKELFYIAPRNIVIKENNVLRFHKVVQDSVVQNIIQQEAGDAQFLLGKMDPRMEDRDPDERYLPVFLVNETSELTGETIVDATHRRASMDDPSAAGGWQVNLEFNDEGTRAFSRVTGANVGKPMAIILDKKVQSAPTIQDKIRTGSARITGLDSPEEARDLAIVLRAGALPAPARIIEERTVGPSLGKDSINQGYKSALVGLLLVVVFMMIYYKFSGFVADVALILNILLLLGVMSTLHATLTLPGIAGIILTIGIAVDANVLIFERVREELDRGKSIWTAIDTGYSRAFVTILDANVTTFIAAVVLYNFGTGPVRGFATTLMIGIAASMFTAIYVTRTLFEFLLSKKLLKRLSI